MTEIKPHSSHWGAFEAVVEGGQLVAARPFARDPCPGSLLDSMPDAVHSKARIDRPYVRAGWLKGGRRGSERGGDAFIPVSRITELLERQGETLQCNGHGLLLPDSRFTGDDLFVKSYQE